MHDQSVAKLSRITPIFLLLVFLLPLVLATLAYFFHDRLPALGTKNHGELIHPARPLEQFVARTANGQTISLDYLKGKWTFLYVGNNECDLYCEAALYKTRQARLAQGENLSRVQRLYLITSHEPDNLSSIMERHPRMTEATLKTDTRQRVLETLGENALGKVFLVDPLGNVMMRYDNEATAHGMIKDLQHLIRASRIG
jgi:cytochrome oxidase Cu insertion factor (SCO1/SenC/PrrC family)